MLFDILKAKSNIITDSLFCGLWRKTEGKEEVWETLYESNETQLIDDSPYSYFWISSLGDVEIPMGSQWRITFDGVLYACTVTVIAQNSGVIGNTLYVDGSDDGSEVPLGLYHTNWGAWSGSADSSAGNHSLKVERLVTS